MEQNTQEKTLGAQLLDVVGLLLKYRRGLVRFVGVAVVGTFIVTLLLPKWYRSTASVFPAEKTEMLAGFEGISPLIRNFSAGKALSSLTGNDETDRYLAILKSSTVMSAVIEKFDLVNLYDYAGSSYKME
jgi:uncharacterized protein involved in exopolysaccharide biosynthesis